jgi:sugar O-acyltransferase (sialic acid O-acetyltransferase NeuD family)
MTSLVLIGAGELAEVVLSLLGDIEGVDPVACAVERGYLDGAALGDLPVVAIEALEDAFPASSHDVLVCVGYRHVNRDRERLAHSCEERGYRLWSFVHPAAWVSPDASIGSGCIVFPRAVVEPHAVLGDGVVLWSGSLVAHNGRIGDFCFLAPNATLGGGVTLGSRCFVGANATVRDGVTIGAACVVGAGALVKHDAGSGAVYPALGTAIGTRESDSYDNL